MTRSRRCGTLEAGEEFAAATVAKVDRKAAAFAAEAGKERLHYLDGRKVEEERGEGTVKVRTKRKGETVVVDTEFPSGREVVQTYEILKDVRRLVVTTKISGGRSRPFSFRRVYDPELEPLPATPKSLNS